MSRRPKPFLFRRCERAFIVALLALVIAGPAWCQPALYAPSAAPANFTTRNYALTFRIPAGLYRCALPPSFVGADHGVTLYLSKPAACSTATLNATAPVGGSLPRITIFYSYNIAPTVDTPSGPAVPATNAALMAADCAKSGAKLPATLKLFGAPAMGCLKTDHQAIDLVTGALYSQDSVDRGAAPDSLVRVELTTTRSRFAQDLRRLSTITNSLQVCAVDGSSGETERPKCAPATGG